MLRICPRLAEETPKGGSQSKAAIFNKAAKDELVAESMVATAKGKAIIAKPSIALRRSATVVATSKATSDEYKASVKDNAAIGATVEDVATNIGKRPSRTSLPTTRSSRVRVPTLRTWSRAQG